MSSPFLKVPESEWVASNTLAFAIRDRYPVSPGHTLVIPRRPVATWFEATPEEQRALFELVDTVKRWLETRLTPPDRRKCRPRNRTQCGGSRPMRLEVRYTRELYFPSGVQNPTWQHPTRWSLHTRANIWCMPRTRYQSRADSEHHPRMKFGRH